MTTSINVETLSETVGRIVDKDVTTDKNKEISSFSGSFENDITLISDNVIDRG